MVLGPMVLGRLHHSDEKRVKRVCLNTVTVGS